MLHSFTRNHDDLSTDAGFQFEFFCDCCGNGFKSTFIESTTYKASKNTERLGRGASVLGNLFGGQLSELGWAIDRGSDLVRDQMSNQSPQWRKEQERAFDEAQAEVKPHFRKCTACQKWACVDCWNDEEGLCVECAPNESSYVAKARSKAMQRNIDEVADTATVWTGNLESRTTTCPKCGKPAGKGKFCHSCGAPLGLMKCPTCGSSVALGVKFCSECGSPMKTKSICPDCGTENEPGVKFCGECGKKLI
jgi:hypothetical protein